MAVRGVIIEKYKVKRAVRASQRALARAYREVALEMEVEMQVRCRNKQYPPASKPGQYPAERTGNFVRGINVTGTANGITVASGMLRGKWLEEGTSRMAARPWAKRVLVQARWEKKIAEKALKYTGGGKRRARR